MFEFQNATQTYQRFVDEIIRCLDFVYAYVDDFLIASDEEKQHRKYKKTSFKRLGEYTVVINPAKCEFSASKITFLGYTDTDDEIKPVAELYCRHSRSTTPCQTSVKLPQNDEPLPTFHTRGRSKSTSIQRPVKEWEKGQRAHRMV
jgi:translation initiation factor IF-2